MVASEVPTTINLSLKPRHVDLACVIYLSLTRAFVREVRVKNADKILVLIC